jgi:hypothetical protein
MTQAEYEALQRRLAANEEILRRAREAIARSGK